MSLTGAQQLAALQGEVSRLNAHIERSRHIGRQVQIELSNAQKRAKRAKLAEGRFDRLRAVICRIAGAGSEGDDHRLSYLSVQIDRSDWDDLRGEAKRLEGGR